MAQAVVLGLELLRALGLVSLEPAEPPGANGSGSPRCRRSGARRRRRSDPTRPANPRGAAWRRYLHGLVPRAGHGGPAQGPKACLKVDRHRWTAQPPHQLRTIGPCLALDGTAPVLPGRQLRRSARRAARAQARTDPPSAGAAGRVRGRSGAAARNYRHGLRATCATLMPQRPATQELPGSGGAAGMVTQVVGKVGCGGRI